MLWGTEEKGSPVRKEIGPESLYRIIISLKLLSLVSILLRKLNYCFLGTSLFYTK